MENDTKQCDTSMYKSSFVTKSAKILEELNKNNKIIKENELLI
ncbi:hypothetical protein [Helicobacter pullorum]|nr:hypothetical protein [Helicobacter pullorum]